MQPIKPETRRFVLENNPQASPEEMDEYERLLSERFLHDPDLAPAPVVLEAISDREDRLAELHQKLFGFLEGRNPER